jgi:hypothetical protein
MYEKNRIAAVLQQADQREINVGYVMEPSVDLLIPMISILTFTAITHIFYRYLTGRPRSLALFWLIAGTLAVSAGWIMKDIGQNVSMLLYLILFVGISYFTFRRWRTHLESLSLQWQVIGVSGVITAATAIQILGLFNVQRFELRHPATWVLCLLLVLFVNFIFSAGLRVVFEQLTASRFLRRT